MNKHDGGPAFPEAIAVGPAGDIYPGMGGMSLRDWFAGQALAGLSSFSLSKDNLMTADNAISYRSELSYRLADAMIAERAKALGSAKP